MSKTTEIFQLLSGNAILKTKFSIIGIMVLPVNEYKKYVSVRKTESSYSTTLDGALNDNAAYTVSVYAEKFAEVDEVEELILNILNSYMFSDGQRVTIRSVSEEYIEQSKKFEKVFTIDVQ